MTTSTLDILAMSLEIENIYLLSLFTMTGDHDWFYGKRLYSSEKNIFLHNCIITLEKLVCC